MSSRDRKADVLYADSTLLCCLQDKCSKYNPEAIKPGPTVTPISVVVALGLFCKKCKSVYCEACFASHSCTARKKGTYSFAQLQAAAERAAPGNASGSAAQQQHRQPDQPSLASSGTELECSPEPVQAAAASMLAARQGPGRQRRRISSSQPCGKLGKQWRTLPSAAALAKSGKCKLYDVGACSKKAQYVCGRALKDSDQCPDYTHAFYPSSTWMQQWESELSDEDEEPLEQNKEEQDKDKQQQQVASTPGESNHLLQQPCLERQCQQQQAAAPSCRENHTQAHQQALEQHCSSHQQQRHEEQRCSNEPEQEPNSELQQQAQQQQQSKQKQAQHDWDEVHSTPFADAALCSKAVLGGNAQMGQRGGSMAARQQPAAAAGDKHQAASAAAAAAATDLAPFSKSAPPGLGLAVAAAQTTGAATASPVADMRVVASADVGVVAAAAAAAVSASPVRYPDTEAMHHLCGYVPELPPVAPGEVRALGQTMHPAVAERYKQVCGDFWCEVAAKVAAMQSPAKPTRAAAKASRSTSGSTQQLLSLHVALDPAWIPPTMEGSMTKWCKDVGIDGDKLLRTLVDLIEAGLSAEGATVGLGSAEQLPQTLPCRFMEPYSVPQDHPVAMLRGQKSVRAAEDIPKGTILGAYQGYMLFEQGFSELKLRAKPSHFASGQRACDRACASLLWEMQTESYAAQDDNMQVPCAKKPTEQQPGRLGKGTSTAAAAAAQQNRDLLWCSAFGYGNMTALVNDPSMDPLSVCFDDAAYAQRDLVAQPNVVIRVLWVRHWPFLFMITDRDIQKGQDFWYDYTAPYWRIIRETLQRINQITGMSFSQAFEAAVKLGSGQGAAVARLLSGLQGEEAPTQTVSVPLSGASAARRYAEAAEGIPPQGSSAAAALAAAARTAPADDKVDKEQDSAPAVVADDDDDEVGSKGVQDDADMHADSLSEGADVSGPAAVGSEQGVEDEQVPRAAADSRGGTAGKLKSSKASSSKQNDLPRRAAKHLAAASGRHQQQERSKQHVSPAAGGCTGRPGKHVHDTGSGSVSPSHHQQSRSRSRSSERGRGRRRSSSRGRLGRPHKLDEARNKQGGSGGGSLHSHQRNTSAAEAAGRLGTGAVEDEPAPKRGRFLTLPAAGVKPRQQQNTVLDAARHGATAAAAAAGVAATGADRRAAAAPRAVRRRRSRSRSRSRSRNQQPLPQQHQQQQQRGHQPAAGRATHRACIDRHVSAAPVPGPPQGYAACRSPPPSGPGPRSVAAPVPHMPVVGQGCTGCTGDAGRLSNATAVSQQGSFGGLPVLAQQQDSVHFALSDGAAAATSNAALNRAWVAMEGASLQHRQPPGARSGPGSNRISLSTAQPGRPGFDRGPSLWRGQQPGHQGRATADLQPGRAGPVGDNSSLAKAHPADAGLWRTNQCRPGNKADSSSPGGRRPPRQIQVEPAAPAAASAPPTTGGAAVVWCDVVYEQPNPLGAAASSGAMQVEQQQQLVREVPAAAAARAAIGVAGALTGGLAAGYGVDAAIGRSQQPLQLRGAAAAADVIDLVDSPHDIAAPVAQFQHGATAAVAAAGSVAHLASAAPFTPVANMAPAPAAGSVDPAATAAVVAEAAELAAPAAGLVAGFEALSRPTGKHVMVFSDDEADSDSDSE